MNDNNHIHPHPHEEDSTPSPLALPGPHPDLPYRVTVTWQDDQIGHRAEVHDDITLFVMENDVYYFHNIARKFFTVWVKHPNLLSVSIEPLFDIASVLQDGPPTSPITPDMMTAFITPPIGLSRAMYIADQSDPDAIQIWYKPRPEG